MSELPTINLKKPKESYGSSMMNEEINPTKTFHWFLYIIWTKIKELYVVKKIIK